MYKHQPICPDLTDLDDLNLPDAADFTSGGDDIAVDSGTVDIPVKESLAPGSYGDLTVPANPYDPNTEDPLTVPRYTELELTAVYEGEEEHAYYYFDSITVGGLPVLYLDLSGTKDIRIFTTGDVVFGEYMKVEVKTDGLDYTPVAELTAEQALDLGARVYWEIKELADFSLGGRSNWFGSVYTPKGDLGVGNRSYLIGSFYSGGGHSIQGSEVLHVPANYFLELED